MEACQGDCSLGLLTSLANRVGEDARAEVYSRQPHIPVGRQKIEMEQPVGRLELSRDAVDVRATLIEDGPNPFAAPETDDRANLQVSAAGAGTVERYPDDVMARRRRRGVNTTNAGLRLLHDLRRQLLDPPTQLRRTSPAAAAPEETVSAVA